MTHNLYQMLKPPKGATLATFSGARIRFDYPAGGLFAEFDRGEDGGLLRLLVMVNGALLQFDIERVPADQTAHQAAEAIYAAADRRFNAVDNVPPLQLSLGGVEAWRCRKRFVDGAAAPLLIDTAFAVVGGWLYRLDFAAEPERYAAGRWIFDTLLTSFAWAPGA